MLRLLSVLVALLPVVGFASTPDWKLRNIHEDIQKARGSDPKVVWEEVVVIVAIDCPKLFPEIVEIKKTRIESTGHAPIVDIMATVAGHDDDYRRGKWRRIYFSVRAARLKGLKEPVLKANISSKGFPDIPVMFRLKESQPNQVPEPTSGLTPERGSS